MPCVDSWRSMKQNSSLRAIFFLYTVVASIRKKPATTSSIADTDPFPFWVLCCPFPVDRQRLATALTLSLLPKVASLASLLFSDIGRGLPKHAIEHKGMILYRHSALISYFQGRNECHVIENYVIVAVFCVDDGTFVTFLEFSYVLLVVNLDIVNINLPSFL